MPMFSSRFPDLGIQLGQLERDDLTRRALADEGDVDDPDRASSTSSASAGAISPRNSLPGNATIM